MHRYLTLIKTDCVQDEWDINTVTHHAPYKTYEIYFTHKNTVSVSQCWLSISYYECLGIWPLEEEKMNEQKYEPHLMHFILISDDVFFWILIRVGGAAVAIDKFL